MHDKKKILSLLVPVALAIPLLVHGEAQGRSQAAILGHERFGSNASCFGEFSGGPFQLGGTGCNQPVQWVMPLVYDNAFNANIRVSAAGAGSGTRNVQCTAFSATGAGALSTGTTSQTVLNTGGTEDLVTSVFANGFGGTWVACFLDVGTRLFNVLY